MRWEKSHNSLKEVNLSKLGEDNFRKILPYFGLSLKKVKQEILFQRDLDLDVQLRAVVIDSYKVSDEGFFLFIPDSYIHRIQKKREEIHLRLMKISTILLVEHISFFEAFGIKPDNNAKQRFVLFSFVKRVYDDLIDSNYEPSEVYRTFCRGKTVCTDPEYQLLARLGKLVKHYVPLNEFKNFYKHLPKAHKTQSKKPENAKLQHLKEIAFQKAQYSFLVDSYVMINDLPNDFVEQRKLSAELFQCIDDMSDLKNDLKDSIPTYINQLKDPGKILRDKYAEIYNSMRKAAIDPSLYLYLMNYFMERAIVFSRGGK
jgi:hypothetical protein